MEKSISGNLEYWRGEMKTKKRKRCKGEKMNAENERKGGTNRRVETKNTPWLDAGQEKRRHKAWKRD